MIIAVSGDLHRGGSRAATCERVLYAMADDAARRGAEVLAVPGDYWDASPSEEDLIAARRWNEHVSAQMAMVILAGNHDPEFAVPLLDAFTTSTKPGRIRVVDEPAVIAITTRTRLLRIACLTDLRAKYLASRAPKGTPAMDAARIVLAEMAATVSVGSPDVPTLFLGHLTVGGARMDNDQPARSAELAFKLSDIGIVPAHAYALGHIHLRQQWLLNGAPCFYTGSPYGTDYGDLSPKSYTLLHWNGKGFDVEVVPTVAPRLVLLTGTWQRDGDSGAMSLAYAEQHETAVGVAISDLGDSDVRLRYDVPNDDRAAAERAVAEHRDAILAAGALACAVDPVPVKVTRSRAVNLAGAKSTGEKIDAYWQATSTRPETTRRSRILGIVARLEPCVTPAPPVSLVRVDALQWCGIGPLQPAGALPSDRAGVHAIVGPNRAGKSTLLASIMSALWCEGSKGSLDSLASGEDGKIAKGALVSVKLTTATGSWTVEQDPYRETVEAREDDGTIVYKGGRKGYYAWAERRIPERTTLERIAFLPPKKNGLLDVADGALKDALLTLAGSTHLAALADLVRADGTELKGKAKAQRETIVRAGDPGALLRASQTELVAARQRLASLGTEHETGARVVELQTEAARLSSQHAEVTTKAAELRAALVALEPDASPTLSPADLTAAQQRVRDATARRDRASIEWAAAKREMDDLDEQAERARSRARESSDRAERMAARLTKREAAQEAVERLPAATARAAWADINAFALADAPPPPDLRVTLSEIRDVAAESTFLPTEDGMAEGLHQIEEMAESALSAPPVDVLAPRRILAEQNAAQRDLAELQRAADALADLEVTEVERVAALAIVEEEDETLALLRWRHGMAQTRANAAQDEEDIASDDVRHATAGERHIAATLASQPDASARTARAAILTAQLDESARILSDLTTQRDALVLRAASFANPEWPPPSEERQRSLSRQMAETERAIARAEDAAERHEAAVFALQSARADLDLMERDLGDLAEALRVLGPKGAQAFEADAIGEEIADDATALLQRHGFRWLLRYAGLRGDGDGKQIEQARWMLTEQDKRLTYDARASGGGSSGGQEVIVATAVFLAAACAVVRRGGGVPDATLTIDEMTSAVREPLVQPWLAMLRDGATRAGVKLVLLVPPNDKRLVEACDGVVMVEPTDAGSVVR